MKAASAHAYFSKKALKAIAHKRAARPLPKPFKEDEEKKTPDVAMKDPQDSDDSDLDNRSCQSISSDELDGGLNLSDDEEKAKKFRVVNKAQKAEPARKFRQEIDMNVFKINFSELKDKGSLATGDPEECAQCKAIFNKYSHV
mmetsp:Transcript_13222/g.20632  ORF Transcript_13222/g.20632 Transcript_13222/m.20632 type:complete len:143 (+) Transcript_13222:18-446(+)